MAFKGLEQAQIGISMFPTDFSIQPAQFAMAVEERGFDSLYFPEHTHIPTSRQTPFPGGGDLPREYWHSHDPFVALSVCAAVTTRIRLGTGICLLIERDPITTAKAIASLDALSNGRAVIGIGAGWNREEMENHGADYNNRWPILREKVLAMKEIWSNDEAEFHGEFVNFDPIWSWPKPNQSGGPPIWIGANSKYVFDRIADYADGWMPIGRVSADMIDQLRTATEARGRSFNDMDLSLFAGLPDAKFIAGQVERGFDEVVLNVPSASRERVLPLLDRYASVLNELRG